MGRAEKVELRPEAWAEAYRPLLALLWGDRPRYLDGIVGAIERGHAVLFVARRDGEPVGALVVAFQPWPVSSLFVLGMVTVPHSGFEWGPALWPEVRALARRAGAETVECDARDAANARRLSRLGFVQSSFRMVSPC